MRFSSPMTTSRLRRPMSASMHPTRCPAEARATPMLAAAVVLPTPPFPDVTVTTRAAMRRLRSIAPSFVVPRLGDELSVAQEGHLRPDVPAPLGRNGDAPGNTQLGRGQVEGADAGAFIAAGAGMDDPAQVAPHHDVAAGHNLGARIHVAQHHHMPGVADDLPRAQSPIDEERPLGGNLLIDSAVVI